MSKIGRKPIALNGAKVEVKGQEVHYSGKNSSGVHVLPPYLTVEIKDGVLTISPKAKVNVRAINNMWGLHRALLSNKVTGSQTLFEKQVQITGLGYKALLKGAEVEFSLGYSHKITVKLPKGVTLELDKTGQLLTFKSCDKELMGQVCSNVRALKPVEPYKGTGVRLTTDVVIRKAGKTKSA